LVQCSKLYGFHFTSRERMFDRSSQISQSDPSSLGTSVKDLNFSASNPAFPGASTVQTLNTYLKQVCHSKERLQITTFQFHVGIEHAGEVQGGLDILANFIDEKLDRSILSFLYLNAAIYAEYEGSFGINGKLANSISSLSNLEYLLLRPFPLMKNLQHHGSSSLRTQCENNRAFVMMMLNNVSSTRLKTALFLLDSVLNVEDLEFFDWAAIGNTLCRPDSANLESVAFDCTGKGDWWVEKLVAWLGIHVREHIPPHIVLGVGSVDSTGSTSTHNMRNPLQVQALSGKVFGFSEGFNSLLDSYLPQ
ncbi:hypothetical protein DL96DRAFT_1608035, partial [Flagelloscypha sp. PMI_526]